jgi:hypothetical protein
VGVCKIWYGEGGTRQSLPCGGPPAVRAPFRLPPSHIPADPNGGRATPPGARGPLFIFRKIILYGETKKSTHGHTTRTPTRTGARSCRSSLPGSQPTLGLPCTRRGRRRTFSQPFLEISVRFPLASPAGPREPYRVAGLPCTQPSQAGAPRSLPGSPASAVQGSRAAYPGASARPHRRSVSPASPTGRRAH